MTPEEALEFIDSAADGGLGAPDYAEAYGIVKATLARVAELEEHRHGAERLIDRLIETCPEARPIIAEFAREALNR